MKRSITNAIRFIMDELIPPILRDNRFFMYPAFLVWAGGRHSRAVQLMDHKKVAFGLTDNGTNQRRKQKKRWFHFITFYAKRETDLNKKCLDRMRELLFYSYDTLLDVGAGKGHWIKVAKDKGYSVTACDLYNALNIECQFVVADVRNLPFNDNAFDVVTCTHTLEHIVELERSIKELKRVTKHILIIVVPCQRYNYLTLDGHVNFFHFKEKLTHYFNGFVSVSCYKLGGDWLLVATKQPKEKDEISCT